jgi:hypothetical protein
MLHPSVIALAIFIAGTIALPFWRQHKRKQKAMNMDIGDDVQRPIQIGSMVMCGTAIAMFAFMIIYAATHWPMFAALSVYCICAVGIFLALIQILRDALTLRSRAIAAVAGNDSAVPWTREEVRREWVAAAWIFGLVGCIALVGFHITFLLFPMLYTKIYGGSWKRGAIIGICGVILVYFVFDYMQGVIWPDPILLPFLYK